MHNEGCNWQRVLAAVAFALCAPCLLYRRRSQLPRLGTMNRGRRRAAPSSLNRIALWLPSASAVLVAATCATAATCAVRAPAGTPGHVEARWRPARLAFLSTSSRLGSLRHGKGGAASTVQAVQSRSDATKEGEPRRDGIDVHDDSWYLGDGGFAERHLEDEEHIAAKKVRTCFSAARC